VKYVQDLELAYIIQRYREIHDSLHVLLEYDVSVAEELAIKWYEMSVLGLPSASLASFFGPINLLA
jgi:ubiquinone biosynthesis protein COQ4